MINAHFEVENPEAIEFTLTATLTLSEWRKVKDALGPLSHGADLYSAIRDMISMAELKFRPDES